MRPREASRFSAARPRSPLHAVLAALDQLAEGFAAGRAQADVPILGAAGDLLRAGHGLRAAGHREPAADGAGRRLSARVVGLDDHRIASGRDRAGVGGGGLRSGERENSGNQYQGTHGSLSWRRRHGDDVADEENAGAHHTSKILIKISLVV